VWNLAEGTNMSAELRVVESRPSKFWSPK